MPKKEEIADKVEAGVETQTSTGIQASVGTQGTDIQASTDTQGTHRSFFDLCFILLICGVFGWVWETLDILITQGQWTDRGYLFVLGKLPEYLPWLADVPILNQCHLIWGLPFIEIYGVGAVLITVLFARLRGKPVILFFSGMVAMTLFELGASYLLTWLVHKSYWDYSNQFLNFQGRICLTSSLAWGMLTLVAVYWLDPFLDKLYAKFGGVKYYKAIILVLMAYTVFCAITKYWLDPSLPGS
ncbi:MAG: putative ABC transporter permease [Propionibacteriaceae bacterium]|nr:putative ABC transporter permease [Propionibacteriaceae bacterium]